MEHLELFYSFKQEGNDISKAIDTIISDVGLSKHRDNLAKNLSGGNKRKLCVALALAANSKIVFLDEPTSGMDQTARRRLWNMLGEYKKDRIIILTTHDMNEADILGDRIGIMKDGHLHCFGSSQFLKKKLGSKYNLQIKLDKNSEPSRVAKFVQGIDPRITVAE